MRERIKKSHFYEPHEVYDFIGMVEQKMSKLPVMDRKDRAALQYFMREFMYLPMAYIARVLDRKPWHVNQTIERMKIAANETRIPVTMNLAYREQIEFMDELCREYFDGRNMELSSIADESEKAYVIWNAQKACECFEEIGVDLSQSGLADELLRTLGLPAGGWMSDVIVRNFRLQSNESFDS